MEDLRYKQIEDDTRLETETLAGLYAFSGFGRSTEAVEKKDKVQALGQERIQALANLASLEQQAKEGADVEKALASAQLRFQKLAQESQKRISELSMKLSDIGQASSQKIQSIFGIKSQSFSSQKKSFKVKTPKVKYKTTPQKVKPMKNILATSEMKKSNFNPLKSISRITSFERLKSFGSKTTLSGFNA